MAERDGRRRGWMGIRLEEPRRIAGRDMLIRLDWREHETTPKELASGGYIEAPYVAVLSDDHIEVRLIVDVIDARVSCRSYTVTEVDGAGLEHRTTEVFRGMKLRELLASVIAVVPPPGSNYDVAKAVVDAAGESVRRRRPVDDARLREFAEAYGERWTPGGHAEFARSIGASERTMWRLLKLARERGFLEAE